MAWIEHPEVTGSCTLCARDGRESKTVLRTFGGASHMLCQACGWRDLPPGTSQAGMVEEMWEASREEEALMKEEE